MSNLFKILYIENRYRIKYWYSTSHLSEYDYLCGKKKCIVFLAADYGNLGDVAITYAQEKFLKENYPGFEIIDVPISKTLSHLKALRQICTPEDIITVVGGGNMSDLYYDIELLRQMVVNLFPLNKVILFPQTMFFSKTLGGKYLHFKAKRIYLRHKNLTITARERWSFQTMKSMVPCCRLVPDIVMSLDKREPTSERKGITICLRNDAESSLSNRIKDVLRGEISNNYVIEEYDTHIGRCNLSLDKRVNELNNIWARFRSSEWIITDRLHGMIFAFITATPCIVLPNNNYKIEGCYSWIKNCGYIYFMDELNISKLTSLLSKKVRSIDFETVSNKLKKQVEDIL